MINENFKKWACSLSGCDGGEMEADTWLCGIEWGGGSYNDGKYYKEDLPKEIENGKINLEHNTFDWKDSITYKYGISFAKLYTAITTDDNVENYRNIANLTGKELFKLNLYPIAFDSTDHRLWEDNNLVEITGFRNKHLFNTWCFFNRFPFFSKC